MKHLRIFLLAVLLFSVGISHAQISAYINGKPVKTGATISPKDLASLEVSFKNPKKLSAVYGKSVLSIDILDAQNKNQGFWFLQKDGTVAVEDFLENTPATKKFRVFEDKDMLHGTSDLKLTFLNAAGQESCKMLQVKIALIYREKTGYNQYAQAISLLEPVVLNVPVWDTKNLYLPIADLRVDKSNISGDFSLRESSQQNAQRIQWYELADKHNYRYTVCAISSDDHQGMNAKELAADFIHEAALYAAQDYGARFSNYDIGKYTIPWDDINRLKSEYKRIPSLDWKKNKEIKKMDLMDMYQPVEINGLKGYTFKSDAEVRSSKGDKWQDNGKFVIYVLNHPTNPKLTLVLTTSLYNEATNVEEMDAFLKNIINGIKHS